MTNHIKNEIDYDNKAIEMTKLLENHKYKFNNGKYPERKDKVNMFDKLNKFKKYDSLEVK